MCIPDGCGCCAITCSSLSPRALGSWTSAPATGCSPTCSGSGALTRKCRPKGQKLVLAYLPCRAELRSAALTEAAKEVRAMAGQLRLPLLDVTDAFRAKSAEE